MGEVSEAAHLPRCAGDGKGSNLPPRRGPLTSSSEKMSHNPRPYLVLMVTKQK
jgi:hypothetical protein